ncbi:hypothetical protein TNIN_44151 [Trichonephila inaurata madagascariensis]|uniref:Uncharacterized protein n=1 Tax=Trichonephila inaurata madagascariensis TaxID=2747483 RepID=A0A8X6X3P8_9ARAC|nr:hypothetical protein TNIN_44151 [Trichonephila inaurata madagascariensis]
MIRIIYFLALFYTVTCQLVKDDDECKKDKYKLLQVFYNLVEDGEAPECIYELKLQKFQIKGIENDEDDVEIYKEYVNYLESLDEEQLETVQDCVNLTGMIAMEKIEGEIQEECGEEIAEFGQKMINGEDL